MAFALSVGRQLFVNELSGTVFGPASSVFFSTLVAYLSRGLRVFFWLGVALVVAGWFAGSSGARLRNATAGSLHRLGSTVAGSGGAGGLAKAGRWVAPNAGWLRYVALLVGVVTLLWGADTSPERLAWCCLLVLGLLLVIELLIGASSPRDDKATGAPSSVPVPGGGI
jgi:hypothetical protein